MYSTLLLRYGHSHKFFCTIQIYIAKDEMTLQGYTKYTDFMKEALKIKNVIK